LLNFLAPRDLVNDNCWGSNIFFVPFLDIHLSSLYLHLLDNFSLLVNNVIDDILHVDLDLTSERKGLTEIKGFFTSTGYNTCNIWHLVTTVFLHFEVFDSLENFGHMTSGIDLLWLVTVGKDIKQIIDGEEEESWESVLLGSQEVHQGFLAKLKIGVDLLESIHEVFGKTELEDVLDIITHFKDFLDISIDTDEVL